MNALTQWGTSLTLRMAAVFAVLAFVFFAVLGVALYRDLEAELVRRDDAALITRIDQLRTILSDSNSLELIRTKPALFQNMLGNREALLIIRGPGQPPFLVVNPGNLSIPELAPTALNQPLNLSDVKHLPNINGIPFSALAATIDSGDQGTLQVLTGRLMTERTTVLARYRFNVYSFASIAALLLAVSGYVIVRRGLRPLRRVAMHAQAIDVASLGERLERLHAPLELLPMIDAFNAMLDRLGKGVEQLSQVSTDMAHELRTPINNLLGETQVALQQPRSSDAYQQLLASNIEELERLARMLDNMLFLARTDPTTALRLREQLDAGDEMQRIADYFEGPAADAGLTITTTGGGLIWAEPMLLRRALANLCANAITHAAPDTTLSISATPTADGIRIHVRNHGQTIPAEHLPRLFDRFYRVDQSREYSSRSNGLGLSIVATIMRFHEGGYGVTSADGVTCFELFFPGRGVAG